MLFHGIVNLVILPASERVPFHRVLITGILPGDVGIVCGVVAELHRCGIHIGNPCG